MLATRRAPWGDPHHNDPESGSYIRFLAGPAAVASFFLGYFFSQQSEWVNFELYKEHQEKQFKMKKKKRYMYIYSLDTL